MATISDLSCDMVEEILSRVPVAYLGAVRSTCKRWNTLSKSRLLCKAQANQQFVGFATKNSKLCSFRFNIQEEELSVKEICDSNEVFVCNGLLLCVTVTRDEEDKNIDRLRLMVWNPYLGQTRWIQPGRRAYDRWSDTYALGYDNNRRNHKIFRYIIGDHEEVLFEIYDFNSDSWRTLDLDVTPDWGTGCGWGVHAFRQTISLKGNTYFCYYERGDETYHLDNFLCFDFTRERFGEKLHLPRSYLTSFSFFGEEKLAALFIGSSIFGMEVWVTTKIEPNEVLWTNFIKIDLESIPGFSICSLFIDEEKKRAVLFSDDCHDSLRAYIIGENDFFKAVDLGEINSLHVDFPYLCSNSYVPSLVQIKQNCMEKQEEKESQRDFCAKENQELGVPFLQQ